MNTNNKGECVRALQPCKIPGCPNLVTTGYCPEHEHFNTKPDNRDRFKKLDRRKTTEEKRFYSSAAWTRCSKLYRQQHPICEVCEKKNVIVKADLVHHKKKLTDILRDRENPLSFKNLQSLCNKCHLRELYSYRKNKKLL